MSSLEKRGGKYRVVFRYGGRKFTRSLRTGNEKQALASLARLEDNLRRIELGTLSVPTEADVACFLLSDGKNGTPRKQVRIATLEELCDEYLASLPPGSLEESTLDGMRVQMRHLKRILGRRFRFQGLNQADLQRYVQLRSGEKGLRGRKVSATTIQKDLVAFRTMWNWAVRRNVVERPFPNNGLKFPKAHEKAPFQTRAEMDRKIKRGGLSEAEQADLWDCLFLTRMETADVLNFVCENARIAFIYPMFVFAAHTGARRSEMLRSRIDDVDLDAKTVLIREKKRVRGKLTTRRVPLSPKLAAVLDKWLATHPGGDFTFCHDLHVRHSKKHREDFAGLSRDEAHDHFKRTLAGSKWEKLRG